MDVETAAMILDLPIAGPDDLLIDRVIAGDQDAYAEIVTRYQKKIFRTSLAILRDESEADVVTHETFVQAYLKLATFERRAGLETWLTRIAVNRARDVLRKKKWSALRLVRGDGGDEDEAPVFELRDERPDAERVVEASQLGTAIDEALKSLSAQQKLIFTMRHFEERSLEEIAELLDLRSGTVRAHLFRAVHKVRAQLAPWFRGKRAEEKNDASL